MGVIGSYLVTPQGNPMLLFSGVALVFGAVLLNSFAYRAAAASRQQAPLFQPRAPSQNACVAERFHPH